MPSILLVMLGGALGAGFRFQIGQFTLRALGPGFPWGTWIVNLGGGLLMGLLAGTLARGAGQAEPLHLFLGVGVLGGFTTFSAFSLEAFNMLSRGQATLAIAYAISSVAGSVLMLFFGAQLARLFA